MLNFKMINMLVTSFWRSKAIVTSHFAVGTMTDFLAKARLLDRDVNFICR